MSVKRVYVEKKPAYAVAAAKLAGDIRDYLNIAGVTGVRVLQRYDVENLSDETFEAAKVTVFSEPPVDFLYEETFEKAEDDAVFSVEYLPGQFDQRADSAVQCVKLLNENEEPIIHSAQTYVIGGGISEEEREKIIAFVINPVDSRVAADWIFSSCGRCSRLTTGPSGTRSSGLRKGQSPCEFLGGLSEFLSR